MSERYRVIYAPAALEDLREIQSYIARELKVVETARQQTGRIRKQARSLDIMPERYSKVEWEPWASMGMHKLPVDNYCLYYLVDIEEKIVTIVRVFYAGRDTRNMIMETDE